MAKTNYKKQIQRLTGWDNATYRKQYTTYAARARNYARAYGTEVNTAKELYNTIKYPGSLTRRQQRILSSPATRAHKAGEYKATQEAFWDATAEQVISDWKGYISVSGKAQEYERIFRKQGKLTQSVLNEIRAEIRIRSNDPKLTTAPAGILEGIEKNGGAMTPAAFSLLMERRRRLHYKKRNENEPYPAYD